jgi:FkbM family methyltransferase
MEKLGETKKVALEVPGALAAEAKEILAGMYEVPGFKPEGEIRVLDIGACFGAFTLWAAAKWPGAKIDAYEPNPEMVKMLRGNLGRFDIDKRVTVHESAVGTSLIGIGAEGYEVELYDGVNPGCTTLTPDGPMSKRILGTFQKARCIGAENLTGYDFVKIDTEGSELEILHTLPLGTVKAVALEFHRREDLRPILHLMEKAGFTLMRAMIQQPDLGTLWFLREVA